MRRKQLYAMILAGALATGGVPVTAMAADAASETAGEETGDFGSSEDTDNSAAEEQPTEAPAEPTEHRQSRNSRPSTSRRTGRGADRSTSRTAGGRNYRN